MSGKNRKDKAINDDSVVENLQYIKHKIVVMSGKGGVGKSTVATNLAFSLSMHGSEVGLLDADMHGPNIPKMLNIESARITGDGKGIFPVIVPPHLRVMSIGLLLADRDTPVIWRGPIKMSAIKQLLGEVHWGNLDYLVVDLPPGTGDEPLSIAQLIPDSDGAVIVTTPQDVALLDSRKAINFAKTLKMPVIGIIENMSSFVCPHCNKMIDLFKSGGGVKAALDFNVPFLGKIPFDLDIVESTDSGKPLVLHYTESESAKIFSKIVSKIKDFIDGREVKE